MDDKSLFQSTPPRGGRLGSRIGPSDQARFNPRPREGGDLSDNLLAGFNVKFQSTPPRGGRQPTLDSSLAFDFVSIHAPARGATGQRSLVSRMVNCFNPRPREGGDR